MKQKGCNWWTDNDPRPRSLRSWRPSLLSSRTPRSSSWCQWPRTTSPPWRPPPAPTSARWTASQWTANHSTFLPNPRATSGGQRPAPACPSLRCSPSSTVRSHACPSANRKPLAALRSDSTLVWVWPHHSENKKNCFVKIVFFYVSTEDDFVKSWKSRLLSHRRHLLVVLCITVAIILALGIGLGGQFLFSIRVKKKKIFIGI